MKNVEDTWEWAKKHPFESAFAIAVVAVAFTFFTYDPHISYQRACLIWA